MMESTVIDRSVLDNLLESVGGDVEFLGELTGEYLEDSPRQFAAMRQALADGDSDVLRRAAHSLKSNSATFGASVLSGICRDIEYLARDGELEPIAERIGPAECEFAKVADALREATEG